MGPFAGKAPTAPDVANNTLQQEVLWALPSPASVTCSLNSPTLEFTLRKSRSHSGHHTPRDALLGATTMLPTEPDAITNSESVMTPLSNDSTEPDPDMNLRVGGALAPTHLAPPPRAAPRPRPDLRLPSFESLGIAPPHSDLYSGPEGFNGAQETMQEPVSASHADSGFSQAFKVGDFARKSSCTVPDPPTVTPVGRAIQSPVHSYVSTLTPPAEEGYPNWNSLVTVTTAMDSPSTDPGRPAPSEENGAVAGDTAMTGIAYPPTTSKSYGHEPERWFDEAIKVLIKNLRSVPARSDSIKMLSHALPTTPSSDGHIFSAIFRATAVATASPMSWVNVINAIPGRFNLQDLPRSPPATPGPGIGGEDYFTEKVFHSAVSITDYQEDLSRLPRSPRPVVPPSSVDISVVERYIPPSTTNEFADMFNPSGPSILVDRLVELSPHNGSLLFIYPTKAGAQTFMREYLGPILDPILRGNSVVAGFSAELNQRLGSMAAVDQLPDHEAMQHGISTLCARLTQRASATERFHGRRPSFTLSYSSKDYVHLSKDVWARDWWTKQEKPRIREAVSRYAKEAQTRATHDPNNRLKPATELIEDLLNEVISRMYPPGKEPETGVEVSIFVITRSS